MGQMMIKETLFGKAFYLFLECSGDSFFRLIIIILEVKQSSNMLGSQKKLVSIQYLFFENS